MSLGKIVRCVAAIVVVLVFCATALADTLVMNDGREMEGRLISRGQGKVVFEIHKFGSKLTMTYPSSQVKKIVKGDIKPRPSSVGRTTASPQPKPMPVKRRPTMRKLGEEPFLEEAPPIKTYSGPTYYVIPLEGTVGKEMVASTLAKALADAAKRKPTVVVLHINSPGGMIMEVEKLAAEIRKYSADMRVVVLVKKALSAAAITALASNEIYMESAGVFGAATAFRMMGGVMPAAIQEKMQSVWRATARSCAEQGGHSSLLAEAMIDAQMELHMLTEGGKKKIISDKNKGGERISRKGRLLTLTAGEAAKCGLSKGTVADIEALGVELGHAGWTECVGHGRTLAEHRTKTMAAIEEDMTKLKKTYHENMALARTAVPWAAQYTYYPKTGKFTPESGRRWRRRSSKCIKHLELAEAAVGSMAEISEKYEGLFGDPKSIRAHKDEIEVITTRIAAERRKRGPGG